MPPSSELPSRPQSPASNPPKPANEDEDESSRPEFDDSVKLSLDDFRFADSSSYNRWLSGRLVDSFNKVKPGMDKTLACELAKFLIKAWEKFLHPPTGHEYLNQLRIKLQGSKIGWKTLYYPHWFLFAIHMGPGHLAQEPIRQDMSALWGVEFPVNSVFYPADIPVDRQKALFRGGQDEPSPLLKITDRVEDFKAAIDVDQRSIIEAVAEYAPALLNKAVRNDNVDSLKQQLDETREQLQRTREQLQGSQEQFQKTQEQLQKTQEQLQDTQKQCKDLEGKVESSNNDLAAMNRRVDKVVDTCALVLSILTAPTGGERALKSEQAESKSEQAEKAEQADD
ncbi:hypothetical protein ACHAPT_009748 [Fusarium lateritium]